MKQFLLDLFTWKGRWNRLKFWIYPLALIFIIFPLLAFMPYLSFDWYTPEAKMAKYNSDQSNLERLITVETIQWKSIDDINNDPFVINLRNDIELFEQENIISENKSSSNSIGWFLLIFFMWIQVLWAYIWITTYMKRLRDLDKSPWMSLLLFVPFANIYLWIICGFFKGSEGENRFGPDPLGGTADIPKEKQETVEL